MGTVVVQIVVDEKGNVASARGASEEAARKARFEPMKVCGQPVKVSGIITYGFVLM